MMIFCASFAASQRVANRRQRSQLVHVASSLASLKPVQAHPPGWSHLNSRPGRGSAGSGDADARTSARSRACERVRAGPGPGTTSTTRSIPALAHLAAGAPRRFPCGGARCSGCAAAFRPRRRRRPSFADGLAGRQLPAQPLEQRLGLVDRASRTSCSPPSQKQGWLLLSGPFGRGVVAVIEDSFDRRPDRRHRGWLWRTLMSLSGRLAAFHHHRQAGARLILR